MKTDRYESGTVLYGTAAPLRDAAEALAEWINQYESIHSEGKFPFLFRKLANETAEKHANATSARMLTRSELSEGHPDRGADHTKDDLKRIFRTADMEKWFSKNSSAIAEAVGRRVPGHTLVLRSHQKDAGRREAVFWLELEPIEAIECHPKEVLRQSPPGSLFQPDIKYHLRPVRLNPVGKLIFGTEPFPKRSWRFAIIYWPMGILTLALCILTAACAVIGINARDSIAIAIAAMSAAMATYVWRNYAKPAQDLFDISIMQISDLFRSLTGPPALLLKKKAQDGETSLHPTSITAECPVCGSEIHVQIVKEGVLGNRIPRGICTANAATHIFSWDSTMTGRSIRT